jgi:hypothetical protein
VEFDVELMLWLGRVPESDIELRRRARRVVEACKDAGTVPEIFLLAQS